MNVYETKRYEPDFSYESGLPGMFETSKGGYVAHGDYATLFSELEVVKAERDALAVERDAARNALASIYKTATGELPEWSNWHAYLDDIVEEVGAKLAALQAQGVEKFADFLGKQYQCEKTNTAKGKAYKNVVFLACRFARELQEAK
jgi:hypothetical protein